MGLKIKFHDHGWTPKSAGSKFLYDFFWPQETDMCEYECGTIVGLYAKNAPSIDIIMIMNTKPGNGHFELFMIALEKLARTSGRKVRILSFMNERLYHHIKKRSGWINPVGTMDCLEYTGK